MSTNEIIAALIRLDSKLDRQVAEVEDGILAHEGVINSVFLAAIICAVGFFWFAT